MNNYKEIYNEIKYVCCHNMLWWLSSWKISDSGGSEAGNWRIPRGIIFSKSTDFYKVYMRWCQDNLEKPFAAATFIHHLRDQQKSLGIIYDDKCIGTNRGFHNVDLNPFVPVDVPCPWD